MMLVTECIALCERANHLPCGSLMQKTQSKEIAHPRQSAMLLAKEQGHTFSHIARILGMDHSTVFHGCKAARRRREKEIERQSRMNKPQEITTC